MMISLRSTLFLMSLTLIMANPCISAHTDITAEQARTLIDSTDNLIIIDVREKSEYCDAIGHIPGALSYPWNSGVLEARYEELINNEILVVCQSGGRSNQAANFLDSKGYTLVYDMLGGMSAWQWETVPCKYNGGSGTQDDPYQIATAEDLIALGETPEDYDKHFILTADIDLSPDSGSDFKMIGFYHSDRDNMTLIPFTGVFDGNGHTISNFTWDKRDSYVGLFRYVEDPNAEIKNLGLIAPCIEAGIYTGSLVGSFKEGTIKHCYVQGGSLSGDDSTGALVGKNQQGIITDCWSTATVNGSINTGGLVGFNYFWGFITNCSSIGTVTGQENTGGLVGHNYLATLMNSSANGSVNGSWKTGGLVGNNDQSSVTNCYSRDAVTGVTDTGGLAGLNNFTIAMCYSTGAVSGNDNTGPLVGLNLGQIRACFWDTQTCLLAAGDDGTGKATAVMQTAGTFLDAGWDFVGETINGPNDIWKISEGLDYPRLWWEKYGDGTGEPNDPYLIYTAEHLNAISAEPNDWGKHFKLMMDIDLSGYTYDRAVIAPDVGDDGFPDPDLSFIGFFDGNGHTVSHLTISGGYFVGLFGQTGSGATISNLALEAVDIAGTGNHIGSLVGYNDDGNITSCYNAGSVTGGGYAGVGGLVGWNGGSVTSSYSTSTVHGNRYVGGLVGNNWGTITSSYSTGTVDADGPHAGGLVGGNSGSITASYSTGSISGDWDIGGLVGNNYGSITMSFWDVQTSGWTNICGIQEEGATGCDDSFGLTTAEMQTASTFLDAGWDFVDETVNGTDDIWWIDELQDYPRLWWELND